jgi:hypothetical protein
MSDGEITLVELLQELKDVQKQVKNMLSLSQITEVSNRINALVKRVEEAVPPDELEAAKSVMAANAAAEAEAKGETVAAVPKEPAVTGPLILMRESDPEKQRAEDLAPNGVSPDGRRLLAIDAKTAASFAKGQPDPKTLSNLLKKKKDDAESTHFGVAEGVEIENIASARWAIVVSALEDAKILKALTPLIRHRSEQMGLKKVEWDFEEDETCAAWLYRHSSDDYESSPWETRPPVLLYRPGERPSDFLGRHGTSHGPVKPEQGVPFYLMFVGRPGPLNEDDEAYVPYTVQYEIDIFWGVGRLCFTDVSGQHRYQDYTTYAERVVAWEKLAKAAERLEREAVYFGTRHDLDRSTERSADELITPLINWNGTGKVPTERKFGSQTFLANDATRNNLATALKGKNGKPPAILFTATHGMGLELSKPKDLVMNQGALVCADWTGNGPIKRDAWLAGADLDDSFKLDGMIALLFACYGAGTPFEDDFIFDEKKRRPQIAPFPFVAQLPQQMLLKGCLAVLGHVERAWTYSFSSTSSGTRGGRAQSQGFEDVLGRFMNGKRAGSATDQFNVIQGARAAELVAELENVKFGKKVPDIDIATLWMARNDARNYALLGDPAVRLPF